MPGEANDAAAVGAQHQPRNVRVPPTAWLSAAEGRAVGRAEEGAAGQADGGADERAGGQAEDSSSSGNSLQSWSALGVLRRVTSPSDPLDPSELEPLPPISSVSDWLTVSAEAPPQLTGAASASSKPACHYAQ